MRDWIKALPLGLGLPAIIGAASVKPEDAVSNLAAWLHFAGVKDVPDWLASPSIDRRVIIGALILAFIYSILVWGIPRFLRSKGRPVSGPSLFIECASVLSSMNVSAHSRTFWLDLVDPDLPGGLALHSAVFSGYTPLVSDKTGANTIYQCRVMNYGSEPALNVDLMLKLRYQNAVEQANGTGYRGGQDVRDISNSVRISKIDPGIENPFLFYIRNMTPGFVQLAFAEAATVQRIGDKALYDASVTSTLTSRGIIFDPLVAN
jgi:hypothetical protein